MSREIKFKAWDKKRNKMIAVSTLWFNKGKLSRIWGNGKKLSIKDVNLVEFTGLKDKSGKECYEDDWISDGINPAFRAIWDYHLLARLSEIEFEILGNEYEGY